MAIAPRLRSGWRRSGTGPPWRASARRRCAGRRRDPPSTWPTACPSSSTSISSTRTAPVRSGPSSGPPGSPSSATRAWSEEFELAALQDWLSLETATHLLRHRPPDLLLLHFLAPDCFQHDHGPGSPEARWAIEHVDGILGRFLDVLAETGRADLTDVVVVGDHGFLPSRAIVSPNTALHEAGMAPGDGSAVARGPRGARGLERRLGARLRGPGARPGRAAADGSATSSGRSPASPR